jgi:hypothetical protein
MVSTTGQQELQKRWKRESLCMIDDDIDDCDCERLREDCTVLRTEYNEMNETSRRPSKLTQEVFFGNVDLKKKRVGYEF